MIVCDLCGGDVLTVWDTLRCSNCGQEPKGPQPVVEPVEPSGAFL
jgi:hypothetical protein